MEGNNVDEIRLITISDQCHLPGAGSTALRDHRSSVCSCSIFPVSCFCSRKPAAGWDSKDDEFNWTRELLKIFITYLRSWSLVRHVQAKPRRAFLKWWRVYLITHGRILSLLGYTSFIKQNTLYYLYSFCIQHAGAVKRSTLSSCPELYNLTIEKQHICIRLLKTIR